MEYRVELAGTIPDLAAVNGVLLAVDPAAVVDFDLTAGALRVATCIEVEELIGALDRAGTTVQRRQVAGIPSVCCGGCSG